jgi:transposase
MSKTATISQLRLDPEPAPGPKRRTFTAAYKAAILTECDAAAAGSGEIGAILRREGLYSSQLTDWRGRRAAGGLNGLLTKKVGRPPGNPVAQAAAKEMNRLRRENAKLQERLRRSEIIIEAQKKLAELLASLPGTESAE